MGGWLGKYSMLSKVLRSKKKEKEKNRKMKKRGEKKNERKKRRIKEKEKKNRTISYSNLPTMCNPITRTSFVSRDHPFATCTCPPI